MNKNALKNFVKERDEALLSLDKDRIQRFMKKYGIPCPENETIFWAAVHKAIVHINAASCKQKVNSMIWLYTHGFKAYF